jgi:pimeloyl-ACP methyl ester carboxylesterase
MRYLIASSISGVPEYRCPALLLLHGLLGYSFSWRLNLPVLARWFRVYALDALGAGFSDRPYALDCSVAATAIRCLQFMDSVGLDSAHAIGSSYGGAVAASMAEQAPERVRRLVLAAPVNPWSSHGQGLIQFLSSQGGAFLLARLAPLLQPLHGFFLRRMYGDPQRIPPGTLQGYTAPLKIPGTLRHLLGTVKTWQKDMEALRQTYRRLGDHPVLLLWGARDGAVLPESARELQRRILNSELRVLPTVGHLPYEEAPQEFNRIVVEFLRENSSLE